MRTYGLKPWDNEVFDLYSKLNAGLVQLHLVYGRMQRLTLSGRQSGEKTKRRDAEHEVVHGLKDKHGTQICVNFHRGKCTGTVCPHGRSHEPLSAAQEAAYELSFVRRRGGRSRRRDAESGGQQE